MVIRNRLQLPKTHALYIFFKNNKLYANGKILLKFIKTIDKKMR